MENSNLIKNDKLVLQEKYTIQAILSPHFRDGIEKSLVGKPGDSLEFYIFLEKLILFMVNSFASFLSDFLKKSKAFLHIFYMLWRHHVSACFLHIMELAQIFQCKL